MRPGRGQIWECRLYGNGRGNFAGAGGLGGAMLRREVTIGGSFSRSSRTSFWHFLSAISRRGPLCVAASHFTGYRLALGRLQVLVGGDAGLLLFKVSRRSVLTDLFITISYCAWRHLISSSNSDKEMKQRKTPFNR
jgi:hypothetical protein